MQPWLLQGFEGVTEAQRWAQACEGNGQQLAQIEATLEQHHNLRSDTKAQNRGPISFWESHTTGMSFQDSEVADRINAHVLGMAWRLSPHAAIGYQHIKAEQDYQSVDARTQGCRESTTGQAFAYLSAGAFSVETLSSATLSEQAQKRHINVDVDTVLVDNWVATSTSRTAELGTSLAMSYRHSVAQNIGVEFGVKTKAQYAYTSPFEEQGAGNLSFIFESQHQGYVIPSPTLALDTRWLSNKGWFGSRLTLGYQQVLSQHNNLSYGFKDIDGRYTHHVKQAEALSGVMIGMQGCLASLQGLSLHWQYQTLLGQHHHCNLSLSYEF